MDLEEYVINLKIEQFFRADGSLISIPVKPSKKLAVLRKIAMRLEPGKRYPEKLLNQELAIFHEDTAALRRHMIEYQILVRDKQSVYWLKEEQE